MSEIFEEYIKQARENGLITEEELTKEAGYQEARVGSDSEEVIRMLYGVKPEDEEEAKDITERAHPDTAVVAPAYDAMNAVVENGWQRNYMMNYIARKIPDGHLTQRRYIHYDQENYEEPFEEYKQASDNLVKSLAQAGFALDHKNEEDMAKFADNCAIRLRKEGFAWLPWAVRAIKIAPVILGYTSLVNHFRPSKGIINDINSAIKELREASPEVYPQTQNAIKNIVSVLKAFRDVALEYLHADTVPEIKKLEDIETVKQDQNSMKAMRQADNYIQAIRKLMGYLPGQVENLKNSARKSEDWGHWLEGLKYVSEFVFPSELEDAYRALETLMRTLEEEEEKVSKATQHTENEGEQKAQSLIASFKQEFNPEEHAQGQTGDVSQLVQNLINQ